MGTRLAGWVATALCAALGTGSPATAGGPATPAQQVADTLPVGYGTLRQEDVAVRLRGENFTITALPLDEDVIRLLAPDTYRSLHRLQAARADELAQIGRRLGIERPVVFLVSFFGIEPGARFDPEALSITGQTGLFRPVAIVPISPRFRDGRLEQRETATALYVYDEGIRLREPFLVAYDGLSSDSWARNLQTLERERAAVAARAAAAREP